jgi:hypothetical protein
VWPFAQKMRGLRSSEPVEDARKASSQTSQVKSSILSDISQADEITSFQRLEEYSVSLHFLNLHEATSTLVLGQGKNGTASDYEERRGS